MGFLNPWLLLGLLGVGVPILIHLLNRFRFRRVDWAAMDFLVEADKRNRRRIRLEELLLLLLRCLAVLLIALLVARPFLPLSLTGGLFDSIRFDRIVLLDDSPSMEARADGSSAWQDAKRGLAEFVNGLATADSDDSLTLFLASRPHRPVFNGLPINDETVTEISDEIGDLEAWVIARSASGLSWLSPSVTNSTYAGSPGSVVYFVTIRVMTPA